MGHFYFVRHGETVWNVENKICGCTDSPLTQRGHEQAEELGRAFAEQGIQADEILHSPLSRAADTARAIARVTGLPLRCEERLREQNFGRYEGTVRNGDEFQRAKSQFVCRYGGGESMLQLAHRVYGLLDEVTAQPDRVVVLVAHNGISRVVQSYFHEMTNQEYAAFGIGNCQVLRFDF